MFNQLESLIVTDEKGNSGTGGIRPNIIKPQHNPSLHYPTLNDLSLGLFDLTVY
jgi:hypothetical protein